MTNNFLIKAFCRIIAKHDIRISSTINLSRWISLTYQLSEKNLELQSEILIRLATREDIDLLANLEESKDDTGYHIVRQNIKFWNEYGLRCVYVGYLKDDPSPFCWQYCIFASDISLLKKIQYSAMYPPLSENTVHLEGGFVLPKMRQKALYTEFARSLEKFLYYKGIRVFRSHVPCDRAKIAMLKFCAQIGYIPDHWISMVTIRLPFFTSIGFAHHEIKDSDRDKFPLTLFDPDS